MTRPHLSVVTPVYGCGPCLNELHRRLDAALSQISDDYEIVMVNDASPDDAWEMIQKLAEGDPRVKGINLARNFGQHYAITAGLDHARGEWVVVMDCDLQDQPEEIPRLYAKAQEGFDLVVGLRAQRQDGLLKRAGSWLFYGVFRYLTDSSVTHRLSNFGIYSERVVRSIRQLKEQTRSFGLFALWVGFRRAEIDVEHAARAHGRSTYTLTRMLRLATDSIVPHSNRLLLLSVKLGLLMAAGSLLYALWLVARYFLWWTPVEGWTSLIVSLYFTTGLVLAGIGVLSLYVGKIFDEVRGRPLYIVQSTTFEPIQPAPAVEIPGYEPETEGARPRSG